MALNDPRTQGGFAPCVRSGFCCKKAPCILAVQRGVPRDNQPCPFLVGDAPGDYACQLILDNPELGSRVAIGGSCGATMFNPAREALGVEPPALQKAMARVARDT